MAHRVWIIISAWLAAWGLVGLPAAAAAAAAPDRDNRNRIVAVVNTDVITAADVAQAMAPLYGQYQALYSPEELSSKVQEAEQQIVNLLVEERLMLQEARSPRQVEVAKGRWGTPPAITVSDEEIADSLNHAQRQFPSEEEFRKTLTEHGMTLEDLKVRYRDQLMIQKLVDREIRSRVTVAPSEVTAYYQQHMDQYRRPEAARVSNILIKVSGFVSDAQAKAQAHDVWQALAAGADFAELARKYSEGPNAQDGGGMGWVARGRLLPELEAAVFAAEPGSITPVVKSPLGYHLFRVEERRPAATTPLAEVSLQIQEVLSRERFRQRYAEWIAKLKARAYITIKTPSTTSG